MQALATRRSDCPSGRSAFVASAALLAALALGAPASAQAGACCLGPECFQSLQGACAGFWVPDTPCSPGLCHYDLAACCTSTTCTIQPPIDCAMFGGYPVGAPCGPSTCNVGACCHDDGSCEAISEVLCPLFGVFVGNACGPESCPVGACCTGASCGMVISTACNAAWFGGETCSMPTCFQGACCNGSICYVVFEGACRNVNQRYVGVGSVCTSASGALTCCPADYNQDLVLSVQDLFDFLAAFFANGSATDVNQSGTISVQDVFDYLAAYFTGCA